MGVHPGDPGLLFFLVLAPIGAWRRRSGSDPLHRRTGPSKPSLWLPYSDRQADPKHYEKMF